MRQFQRPPGANGATASLDRTVTRQIETLVQVFTDPIVVMEPGWGVPESLRTRITLERMVANMKGETEEATDAEALAYLSNASLVAPPSAHWFNIHMYLFTRFMGDKTPEEMRHDSLGPDEKSLLHDLKRWIMRARNKHREAKRRGQPGKDLKAASAPMVAEKAPDQLRLTGV